MAQLIDGTAASPTPLEEALVRLCRKLHNEPRNAGPGDLEELRGVVGDSAITYALVIASFHWVNRIADLLGVDPEAVPESLRRFEPIRRVGVRVASVLLGTTMDLENRTYDRSYDEVVQAFRSDHPSIFESLPENAFLPLQSRPEVVEVLSLTIEERDRFSSLGKDTVRAVQRVVEDNLPATAEDTEGFHERPADPVEAFAMVGTRYPARCTQTMVDALSEAGHDDLAILDLATVIADANLWARLHRLLGLDPGILYLTQPAGELQRGQVATGVHSNEGS